VSAPLVQLVLHAKSYAGVRIAGPVDLGLARGERVCLVGPSGCGKSTLLRIIAGLDHDFEGTLSFDDASRAEGTTRRPSIGVVFQEPRLFPWLTVAENVGFAAGRRGADHPDVARLLAEVGLSGAASHLPKQLSGGMAQRAALARALFGEPALLLLDEPFSAVDAFTRLRLQDLLLDLAARHGSTLLLVTHDAREAAWIGDRVLALGGRPARLCGEIVPGLAAGRSREDPALARAETRILELLTIHDAAPALP
jgi:sulfonate transport system ATP-binding protein